MTFNTELNLSICIISHVSFYFLQGPRNISIESQTITRNLVKNKQKSKRQSECATKKRSHLNLTYHGRFLFVANAIILLNLNQCKYAITNIILKLEHYLISNLSILTKSFTLEC